MGVGTTTSTAPRPEGPISRSPHLSSEAAHHPPGSTEQPSQEGLQLILAHPKATALPQYPNINTTLYPVLSECHLQALSTRSSRCCKHRMSLHTGVKSPIHHSALPALNALSSTHNPTGSSRSTSKYIITPYLGNVQSSLC